jgi:cytochrome P450
MARGEKPPGQTTIFYDVLSNPQVRPQEKEIDHLQDEAQVIIGAGTITTAHILAATTFYLINNPSIRGKLQAELEPLMQETGGKPEWSQLEQLPYLSAIIQEGLRTSNAISHRLQRVFPDTLLEYNGYTIPTMTPVSMTAMLVHTNVRTACMRTLITARLLIKISSHHSSLNHERTIQTAS